MMTKASAEQGTLKALIGFAILIGALGVGWIAKGYFAPRSLPDTQRNFILQTEIEALQTRIDRLESRLRHLEAGAGNVAYPDSKEIFPIDMTGQGYSLVKTNFGNLLVQCGGVEPYLDGQKITLQIGNPTTATFSGLELEALSGKRNAQPLKNQQIKSTDTLSPGQWTEMKFVVAPATAEEVGSLCVIISLDRVLLRAPIKNE